MTSQIATRRSGRVRQIELAPRTIAVLGGSALILIGAIFVIGLMLGRFLLGGNVERARMRGRRGNSRPISRQSRPDLARSMQLRLVSALNAQLIRLDALGRRSRPRGADRGIDFDKTAAGGPKQRGGRWLGASAGADRSARYTEEQLTIAIDNWLRSSLLASRQLGQRIMPGGLPLIGGWVSSQLATATIFTGRGALAGVDLRSTGSKVISVGRESSLKGYKTGYGNVVRSGTHRI
jgi:hypothetical protein